MEQNKLYFRCLMLSSEKGKTWRKWKKIYAVHGRYRNWMHLPDTLRSFMLMIRHEDDERSNRPVVDDKINFNLE